MITVQMGGEGWLGDWRGEGKGWSSRDGDWRAVACRAPDGPPDAHERMIRAPGVRWVADLAFAFALERGWSSPGFGGRA